MDKRSVILHRLSLLDPISTEAQLDRAVGAYLEGKPVELIERCNFARDNIRSALSSYQTTRGRLRALDRLLDEMGVPG